MEDNSEHETAMLHMVKDHCEVMQIQDKIFYHQRAQERDERRWENDR
jgi:hypothetical protein